MDQIKATPSFLLPQPSTVFGSVTPNYAMDRQLNSSSATHTVEATPLPAATGTAISPKVVTPPTTTVFSHEDVLSFRCQTGFESEEPPPEGQTFHTLKCNKGEWQGVTPVCEGKYYI